MAVYLILMAIVLVLAYPLIERKPSIGKKLCYVIVTFAAMYLISIFRYGLGNDYYSYIYIFRNIQDSSGLAIFNLGYEPAFTVITKLISLFTSNINVLYAIYALLILVPTAYAIFRYSENIWMSTMMFISLTFFYCSLSFIRQSIAFAVILCAYKYVKERNHFKVLLFIFIACLFHSTVIVMIPIYLIAAFVKPTKITVPIYGVITALVYFLSWPILRLAVLILPQYKGYLDLNFITQGYKPVYLIVPAIIAALAIAAHFTGYGKAYPKQSSIFTNFAIFNFIIWFIATKHFVIERFSMYIYIFMIMFIPSIARYYMNCAKVYFAKKKDPEAVVAFDKTVDEVLAEKKSANGVESAQESISKTTAEEADMPLSEEEAEKQRILAEIMAEDAEENIPEDTDITEEEDPELLTEEMTEEMTETDEPEENAVYTKRKPCSALSWDVAGDERYLAENREFKNRSNKFLQFISRPVTIFAAFMVVVVASNLWYNYFGLTVSQKGFHGVMPYKSTIPAYTELMLSTEDKDNKNELLRDEENFLNYMYRLKENDNYSVIISARGDTVGGLNDGARSALKELGLVKLAEAESADRYVAVIEGGKVTREEISDSADIDTGEFRVLGFKTHVISTQRTSTIQMGKKNFSLNERGMNIVVLDNTTKKIVDKVRFKTYYVMLTATR